MRARPGITIIETVIAGAIGALVLTAAFRGIVASTHICHNNAQFLAAEAFAWETSWKWLNKNYEALPINEQKSFVISSEECPSISREATGEAASCVIRVSELSGASAILRHGESIIAKQIDVNVIWGSKNNRQSLNSLGASGIDNSNVPITVYKSSINRNKR